jgi:hypothetical protein
MTNIGSLRDLFSLKESNCCRCVFTPNNGRSQFECMDPHHFSASCGEIVVYRHGFTNIGSLRDLFSLKESNCCRCVITPNNGHSQFECMDPHHFFASCGEIVVYRHWFTDIGSLRDLFSLKESNCCRCVIRRMVAIGNFVWEITIKIHV